MDKEDHELEKERIRALMYGGAAVIFSLWSWYYGFSHVLKFLYNTTHLKDLSLIINLHIFFGSIYILLRCAIKGKNIKDFIPNRFPEFLINLFIISLSVFMWYVVIDGFGIGWYELFVVPVAGIFGAWIISMYASWEQKTRQEINADEK